MRGSDILEFLMCRMYPIYSLSPLSAIADKGDRKETRSGR